MSGKPTPPDSSPASASAAESPAAPAAPRRSRARRLLRVVLIVAVAVVLVISVVRAVALRMLPGILDDTAAAYDLTLRYEHLGLSLIRCDLEIDKLELAPRAGGEPFVALDFVRADVDTFRLLGGTLLVRRVEADGVDARLERRADGSIDLLDHLLGTDADGAADGQAGSAPQSKLPADARDAGLPDLAPPLSIDAVRLQHVRLAWSDLAATPPFAGTLEADVRLSDLGVPGRPTRLEVRVGLRPALDRLLLTARADWSEGRWDADVTLDLAGLHPGEMRDYLGQAGLSPVAEEISAELHARAQLGPVSRDGESLPMLAQIEALHLRANGRPTLTLGHVGATATMSSDGALVVDRLEVGGADLSVTTTRQGATRLAGFELVPAAPSSAAKDETPDEASGPPPVLHAVELHDISLTHRDETLVPPRELNVVLTELRVDDLSAGLLPGAPPAPLRASLAMPGVIGRLALDGALHAADDGLRADLTLLGEPIGGPVLDELLAASGARPTFKAARLDAGLGFARAPDGALTAEVRELSLRDGEQRLLRWDRLGLQLGAESDGNAGEISVDWDRPRVRVVRDLSGGLTVAGFALGDAPSGAALPPDAAPPRAAAPPPDAAPPRAAAPPPTLRRIALSGGVIDLSLHGPRGALDTEVALDAGLADLLWDGAPAPTRLALGVPGNGMRIGLDGALRLGTPAVGAQFTLAATGLKTGLISSFLPPGMDVELQDGQLDATLQLDTEPAAGGGSKLVARVDGLRITESGEAAPRASVGSLGLSARRLDAAAGEFDISSVELLGVRADLVTAADGSLHVAGLVLAAPDAAPEAAPEAASPAASEAGTPVPDNAPGEPTAPAAPAAPAPSAALPHLVLHDLTVGVDEVTLRDLRAPDSAPLRLSDVSLTNTTAIELLPDDPDASPPTGLLLTGRIDPLLDSLRVQVELSPFSDELHGALDVALSGLHGEGLTAWRPELASSLDGSALSDGTLSLHAEFERRDRRRGPLDFAARDGLAGELVIDDFALTATPGGERLVGFDQFRAELGSWQPSAGRTSFKRVELYGTQAHVTRGPEGLRVAGILFPTPPEVPADATSTPDPAAPAASASAEPADALADAPAAPASAPELRIDDLVMAGIDLDYRDATSTPPLVVPLNDLDLSVTNFTTRTFTESAPFLFDLLLGAGTVELSDGEHTRHAPLFETIEAKGRLALAPRLDGWMDARIRGLELAGFAGPAAASGITVSDGRLDAKIGLRAPGDGSLATDSNFTFVDLDVSEPADGPIARYLKLPTPLGSVLFVLRDEQGVITIPLEFSVSAEGVSGGQIAATAASVLSGLIVDALANSPFRVLGAAGDVVGLLGKGGEMLGLNLDPFSLVGLGGPADEGRTTVIVDFGPLDTALSDEASAALADLAERIEDEELSVRITHALGSGDVAAAGERANPTPDELSDYAGRLRRRRAELLDAREELAARLAAAIASGSRSESATLTGRLGGLDADLGLTEDAMDETLGLLRAGAERQAPRRTRAACLALGAARLEVIARALQDAGVPAGGDRLRIDRPRFLDPELPDGGRITLVTAPLATVEEGWWSKITGWVGDAFGWVTGGSD